MDEFKTILGDEFSFNLHTINFLVERDHIVYRLDESGYVVYLYIGDDEYRPFPCDYIEIIDFIKSFKKLRELEITLDEDLHLIESLEPLNELHDLEKIELFCNVSEFSIDFTRNMSKLKSICIIDIPVINIDIFKNTKELTSIVISNGNIEDISVVSELIKLEKFEAPCSVQDASAFKNCKELRELRLKTNGQLSNISDLHNCKKLETLDLTGNKISNIDVLGELSLLKTLFLSRNSIVDIKKLRKMPALKVLSVSDNPIKSIEPLGNINSIESLVANNLTDLVVEDDFRFEEKSQLKYVSLSNCNLKNISFISNLKNLRDLDLSNNQISEVGNLFAFRKLVRLNLANNGIVNVFPIDRFLNRLDLTGNPLENVQADAVFTNSRSPNDDKTKPFNKLFELIANDFLEKNEVEGALAFHYYKSNKNELSIGNIDHHLFFLKHLTSRNSFIEDTVRRRLLGLIADAYIFAEKKDRDLHNYYQEIINHIRYKTIDKPKGGISQKDLFFHATSQMLVEYDVQFRPTLQKLIEEEKMILNVT